MKLEPGHRLSQYRLVEKIGEGGMGVVWKAHDSALDREVAIKILPDSLSQDEARLERFKREARAIAALNHPNIVTIHNIEEHEGHPFLVMELVEGTSLDRKITPGGLPLGEIFDVGTAIADALAVAHEKGVVHRDIKPANVMLTRDGNVKVLDFGLAKMAAGDDAPEAEPGTQAATRPAPLTGEGTVMGTAPYMSPEQLHGQDTDARTDIFSLGILLYEMTTGHRPFRGDSGLELASSTLKDTPRPVTEMRVESPRHLGRIIQQCLEKKPDDRFQTARDVRNQLASLHRETTSDMSAIAKEPIATATGSGGMKRLVGAVIGMLVVGLLGYALWKAAAPATDSAASRTASPSVPTSERKKVVVLPFENVGAPEDEYLADGMTDEITSRLLGVDGITIIARSNAMEYKDTRPALAQIGEELGVDYVLEGTVRWQRSADGSSRVKVSPRLVEVSDGTHLWAEVYDRVLADIFQVQGDIARRVSEELGTALMDTGPRNRSTDNLDAYDSYLQASDYLNRGLELTSEDEIRFAIKMYEQAIEQDPGFALAFARLSVAHSAVYNEYFDRTAERLEKARSAVHRALELDPGLPEAHYAQGELYLVEGKHREALEELEITLRAQPNNADAYFAVSNVHTALGDWAKATVSLKQAMERNPRLGRLACTTGGQFFGLRDFKEAIRYHDRAIDLTPDRPCPYFCMARIYLNRDGETGATRRFLEQLPSGVGLEETPPINLPWVQTEIIDGKYEEALRRLASGPADAYVFSQFYIPKDMLIAQIHRLQGHTELAREHYEAARVVLEEKLRELPDDERVHSSLGIVYAGLGRKEEAIREGNKAVNLRPKDRSEAHGERVKDLAEIYTMVGEYDQAIDMLDRLLSMRSFYAVGLIRIDPTWKALRPLPRFRKLLEKHAQDGHVPHA